MKRSEAVLRLVKKKGEAAFRNASIKTKQEVAVAEGCRCRKSHCVKKYCECYAAGLVCRDNCQCEECSNNGDKPPPPVKKKRKSRARAEVEKRKLLKKAQAHVAQEDASRPDARSKSKSKRTRAVGVSKKTAPDSHRDDGLTNVDRDEHPLGPCTPWQEELLSLEGCSADGLANSGFGGRGKGPSVLVMDEELTQTHRKQRSRGAHTKRQKSKSSNWLASTIKGKKKNHLADHNPNSQ